MRAPLTLIGLTLLAACTEGTIKQYPSLLPRAIETQSLEEPERVAQPVGPDAALDTELASFTATLDKAAADFTAAANDAEAKIAVARGLAEGSEPWLDAQVALSNLDAVRAPATTIASDLESLAIARGAEGQPPYPALTAMIARAEALSAEQSAKIRMLEGALAAR